MFVKGHPDAIWDVFLQEKRKDKSPIDGMPLLQGIREARFGPAASDATHVPVGVRALRAEVSSPEVGDGPQPGRPPGPGRVLGPGPPSDGGRVADVLPTSGNRRVQVLRRDLQMLGDERLVAPARSVTASRAVDRLS